MRVVRFVCESVTHSRSPGPACSISCMRYRLLSFVVVHLLARRHTHRLRSISCRATCGCDVQLREHMRSPLGRPGVLPTFADIWLVAHDARGCACAGVAAVGSAFARRDARHVLFDESPEDRSVPTTTHYRRWARANARARCVRTTARVWRGRQIHRHR